MSLSDLPADELEIFEEIVTTLDGDATLTALLSADGVNFVHPPAQLTRPYLVYEYAIANDRRMQGAGAETITLTLHADSDSPRTSTTICHAIRNALGNVVLTTTNWRSGPIRWNAIRLAPLDRRDDTNQPVWRATIDLEFKARAVKS